MKYQFILSYKATDSETVLTNNNCHPVYGDDLSVTIDREDGEWYYKRKLDGKITFERDDYRWIMARPFDGTFTLTVNETHDGGASWHPYFEGTFSRANLEIDEDNQAASLSSFIEGVYNAIENGKDEDYDLMKIIPDGDAKIVQGWIYPALAIVDYNTDYISKTDIYCRNESFVGPGYKSSSSGFSNWGIVGDSTAAHQTQIYAEAKVVMRDHSSLWGGIYSSPNNYCIYETITSPNNEHRVVAVSATLRNNNYGWLRLGFGLTQSNELYASFGIYDNNGTLVPGANAVLSIGNNETGYYSPTVLTFTTTNTSNPIEEITIYFHYIRLSVLYGYYYAPTMVSNFLNTAPYYKGAKAFNGVGFFCQMSRRTTETPNGHRVVPGTGVAGDAPQFFAPPDETYNWIPINEDGWTYASMWYRVTPEIEYGALNYSEARRYKWSQCWTIGTCLNWLLRKITDNKVSFDESSNGSQFLYDIVNPVSGHEPFDYLVTQKSNVMLPGGRNATRCIVKLQWFLELLRNAFNCYYWLEKRNDGTYSFRVEHVEYFRRGGHYNSTLPAGIDITTLKPRRNFRDYANQLRKTYADQTNKYAYNMQNMVEKYTFSWQGDGGSDAFKGNPMFFKAGWIEPASSESHEVDNIFADLSWLILTSGSNVDSSKNYDGLFLFGGYREWEGYWHQNGVVAHILELAQGPSINVKLDIWATIPEGQNAYLIINDPVHQTYQPLGTYVGTGNPQRLIVRVRTTVTSDQWLAIDFGDNYLDVTIHRIHIFSGILYTAAETYNPDITSPTFWVPSIQNGPLTWPWLQNEHLHYDIPANKWSYDSNDINTATFNDNGTVKMIQKQTVKPVPITDKGTEDSIMDITGIHTSIEGGKTGIITNAKINLSSRNAELTIVYDPVPTE